MKFSKYTESRKMGKGFFSYGLHRRLLQIQNSIRYILDSEENKPLRMLDFGCADDLTLNYLIQLFGDKIEKSVGLDIFFHGVPINNKERRLNFLKIDLSKNLPYPFEDGSYNIAICSAFYKHHPHPNRFVQEIWRILERGGYLLLIDPCPWVVTLGVWLKHFDRQYCPNVWGKNDLPLVGPKTNFNYKFEEIFYKRYWLAPSRFLFDLGFENIFPQKLIQCIGLHQSALMRKK